MGKVFILKGYRSPDPERTLWFNGTELPPQSFATDAKLIPKPVVKILAD